VVPSTDAVLGVLNEDLGLGVFLDTAFAVGAFLVVGGVSADEVIGSSFFFLLATAPFFLTVGGVVASLLDGAALLEREVRLARGVGEDATELREDLVERLEEGREELEFDLFDASDFEALDPPLLFTTGDSVTFWL